MEIFAKLFGRPLVFVYHCFDRIVINGYLSGLSRPEQVVYFFRQVVGVPAVTKEVLSQRTGDYQGWVESFARNHELPIEWAHRHDRLPASDNGPRVGGGISRHPRRFMAEVCRWREGRSAGGCA